MNLFDKTVSEALKNQPQLSQLRVVVEKELLHHDILRVLASKNLLKNLTFIGGTCLRACYGGVRLSEDLDFTGGTDFSRQSLADMGHVLVQSLQNKYGLNVEISEPTKEHGRVDTWKIRVQTRPESNNLPAQRIHIDICALPSYEKRPVMLLNPYGVDMGTSGLIIQAQSRQEIYADKLLAFALRANRIQYRDVWDILWLHSLGLKPNLAIVPYKLKDRHYTMEFFLNAYNKRHAQMIGNAQMEADFKYEMQRFLPLQNMLTLDQAGMWVFLVDLLEDYSRQMVMLG